MRYPFIIKGSAMGLLVTAFSLSVNAQQIDEQELKINVAKIDSPTAQLQSLEPVSFSYDVEKYNYLQLPEGQKFGFLASNVKAEFPSLVYERSKMYPSGKNASKIAKYKEVHTEELIPLLVAAVKEQQAELELLRKEVQLLKEKSK